MTTSQKTEFYKNFLQPAIKNCIGMNDEFDEMLLKQDEAIKKAISLNAYNLADIEANTLYDYVAKITLASKVDNNKSFRFLVSTSDLKNALTFFMNS